MKMNKLWAPWRMDYIRTPKVKVMRRFATLHEEDPFEYRVDNEVKQTIISGQGELHLTVTTERLERRFGISIELEKVKVPFRETITTKGFLHNL